MNSVLLRGWEGGGGHLERERELEARGNQIFTLKLRTRAFESLREAIFMGNNGE
jgi:hypothetical protein